MNKSRKKKKSWVGWCDYFKNEPSTFHKTKSMACACVPSEKYLDEQDKWSVRKVKVEAL